MLKEGKATSPLVTLSNRYLLVDAVEDEVRKVMVVKPLGDMESSSSWDDVSLRGRTGLEPGDEESVLRGGRIPLWKEGVGKGVGLEVEKIKKFL